MKIQNKKSKRYKEFLSILEARDTLRKKIRALGYVELENPIRHGWYLEIKLDPKLETSSTYGSLYKALLPKLEKESHWGKNKKDCLESKQKKEALYEARQLDIILTNKEYLKLTLQDQNLCTPFQYDVDIYDRKLHKYRASKTVAFRVKIPKKYVSLKYTKAFITRRQIIDPELLSEQKKLDNILLTSKYFSYYQEWNGGNYSSWQDEDYRHRRNKLKRDLEGLLTD